MSQTETTTLSLVTSLGSIQITNEGTSISDSMGYDEWFEQVKAMRMVKHLYHSALSDLVKFGRSKFGEARVKDAMSQLAFDLSDVYRAESLASLESGVKMKPNLTAELQYVLGKDLADSPEEQERWANIAVEEKLTPAELRLSIGRNEVVHGLRGERSPGIVTFESVSMQFQRALRQYGGVEAVQRMNKAERENIASLMAPITSFVGQITQ